MLHSLSENDANISACYNYLGNIALEKDDYDNAHSNFLQALHLELKYPDENQIHISDMYLNIRLTLAKKEGYKNMHWRIFPKALSIRLKTVEYDSLQTAIIYKEIGRVYNKQGNYQLVLSNLDECCVLSSSSNENRS